MHDLLVLALRYVRGVWRYRWWMLGIAWVVSVVGWTIVARMPDEYRASAQVYVDTRSVIAPFIAGLAIQPTDTSRTLWLMEKSLFTQPTLEKVMRMTDLDLQVKTPTDREQVLGELKSKIRLGSGRGDNLYTISYADSSPELAKLVVKSVLTVFMEGNLGEVRREQDSARQFVEQQIAQDERRLRELEREIAQFKLENLDILPDDSSGYFELMLRVKDDIEAAELALRLEEERLESLKNQVEAAKLALSGVNEPMLVEYPTSFDSRIEAMQLRLDELLVQYTEAHPDVIAAKRSLEDLDDRREAELRRLREQFSETGGSERGLSTNPMYQQIKMALSVAEAEVASKRGLLENHRARGRELESKVNEITRLAAQRDELKGQYERVKKQHSTLESRLAAAEFGRRAEAGANPVEFRIIDPPRVPSTPSGPPRIALSVGVLVFGLGLGLGVAFLMSQLRPTFDERQLLNDTLGLPVLGSVNMVWTSDQIKARKVRNLTFMASTASLLLVFGTVLTLYQFNIDLLPRLAQTLNLT